MGCFVVVAVGRAATTQEIRPLTLRVVDAASRQPVEGIVVHYIVLRGTYRTSTFGVLPPVEPLVERTIVAKLSGRTDSEGEVSFGGVEVQLENYFILPRKDKIDSEMLFINLEPSEEAKQRLSFPDGTNDLYDLLVRTVPELERVTHPDQRYKGYLLQTVNLIADAHGREQKNATVHFKPENFSHPDRAYFSAELRPTMAVLGK
jgi:hypothetical protein